MGREDSIGVIEGHPVLDETIVFPEHYLADRIKDADNIDQIYLEINNRIDDLKRERFDLVVNLTTTALFAVLAGLIEGRCTRGVVFNEFGRCVMMGNMWVVYLFYIKYNRVMRDLNMLGWEEVCLRIAGVNPASRGVDLSIDDGIRGRCKEALCSLGVKEKDLVVGINPGAYLFVKKWPKEHFAVLVSRLIKEYEAKIIIFGGKGDVDWAHEIEGLVEGKAINLAGGTSLKELAGFLSLCDHLITNDTGPMHIAGAVGTSVLAICGPTRFGPYGEGHLVIEADLPCINCGPTTTCKTGECMEAILPEDVYQAFRFQRGESQEILNNPKINIYSSPDGEPTRFFAYHPLRGKDWDRDGVSSEILKLISLNLWIRENNKVEYYEEEISLEEMEEFLCLEGICREELIKGIDRSLELPEEYEALFRGAITKINMILGMSCSSNSEFDDQLEELNGLYEKMDEGIGRIFSFLDIIVSKGQKKWIGVTP